MHHPNNEPSPWSEFFADELEFGVDYPLRKKLAMAGKVVYSLEARNRLDRLLRRFRPDIAHAHMIHHHLSSSVLALLHGRGIPTVMTAHDLKLACPAYKILNHSGVCEKCRGGNLAHVVINRCIHGSLATSALVMVESAVHRVLGLYRKNLDRVVVPSQFFRQKLIEWGWPGEKLIYIPNFIRARDYTPRFDPGNYLLYFGRLAPEKGLGTLIHAVRKIGARLRIAGSGPTEAELKRLAQGAADQIEFLGHCTGEKLCLLIQHARAVVLPSEWYENAPMSVLEGYASGKIVVGARIGGIPEMIREGSTGFLFDSGNVDQLADTLAYVDSAPDSLLKDMGQHAREYVASTFTSDRYLSLMLELYSGLGVRPGSCRIRQANR
jgi:glycosyltransferase involved in cell wall biosynthesis